jgi:2-polyprenyl-6-methoxyphenol hydroxylase-like FAD-dependent oxidoreductase
MRISKDDPILIIGAGLSGMMTAALLQQREFTHVRVFEQKADLHTQKVPMQISPAAMVALEEIGLLTEFLKEGSAWKRAEWQTLGGKDLRKIETAPIQAKHEMLPHLISKPALYQRLKELLPSDWVQTGREFISFTQSDKSVEAHFTAQHSESGALLIGADGMDSRVRLQMQGDRERDELGLLEIRTLLDRNVLPDPQHPYLSAPWLEVMGQGQSGSLLSVNERQAGLMLYLFPPVEMPPDSQGIKRWLQRMYGSWPQILEAIDQSWPADFSLQVMEKRAVSKSWTQGRVALVGDAAHGAMPFLGFNESLTLVGAASFVQQLSDSPKKIERAFQRYEKARIRPTRRYARLAQKHAKMVMTSNPLSFRIRNLLYPSLPIGIRQTPLIRMLGEG